MLERAIIAAVIILAGVAVWCAYNRLAVRQVKQVATRDPLLAAVQRGVPTVLYFTTPSCIPCRTLQQPTLSDLQTRLGAGVQIIKVDATEQPDVADRWGVFSAPTTFILDGHQTPQHVNRGVASIETLLKQIQSVA